MACIVVVYMCYGLLICNLCASETVELANRALRVWGVTRTMVFNFSYFPNAPFLSLTQIHQNFNSHKLNSNGLRGLNQNNPKA